MAETEHRSPYDLPTEIRDEILTKLPAKSILRCRSVCKTWNSLISSPKFITDHSAQTLNHSTSNRVLVHRGLGADLVKFSSHDESSGESHEHDDLPEQFSSGRVRIVGFCNGLGCLVKFDKNPRSGALTHMFVIWNPSIRKSVQPESRRPTFADDTSYLLGFGFDPESGDYKVLRSGYLISQHPVSVVSEIFDLGKGVWRAISPPMRPRHVMKPDSPVYFHGSLHWIGYEDPNQPNYVILSFNLSSEVSQKMGMPGDAEFKVVRDSDSYSIWANNGLLSLALLRMQHGPGDVRQDCCSVWSMKEYGVAESWTKLFYIQLPYARSHLGLLGFWENGQVLTATHQGGTVLVVYNPENKTSKPLLSVRAGEFVHKVCFYQESMVLMVDE